MNQRRGLFFTVLVILIISLLLLTYSIYTEFADTRSAQRRVKTLNSYLFAIEQDMNREVYIAGFRAIFIIENKIAETGTYSTDPRAATEEIFFNGTLAGQSQPLMLGVTFNEVLATINEKAQKINANVTLTAPKWTIEQRDPWHVTVQLNVTLELKDKGNIALWRKNESFEGSISVENFEDPLYIISTNGLVTNKIIKTPYARFISGVVTNPNVTNLTDHVTNSYYFATPLAPSFLDRLMGNLTNSTNGIESMVNLQELSTAGITVQDKTVIDYLYFSSQNPTAYHITFMPAWFKLDQPHLKVYDIENMTG